MIVQWTDIKHLEIKYGDGSYMQQVKNVFVCWRDGCQCLKKVPVKHIHGM